MTIINLNKIVEVILTEYGKQIVDKYKAKQGYQIDANYNESGRLSIQLWRLMNIFGDEMYFGVNQEQVFKNNEIMFNLTGNNR